MKDAAMVWGIILFIAIGIPLFGIWLIPIGFILFVVYCVEAATNDQNNR
jgi:hypothetical protein